MTERSTDPERLEAVAAICVEVAGLSDEEVARQTGALAADTTEREDSL
jgi:hypothetical protein